VKCVGGVVDDGRRVEGGFKGEVPDDAGRCGWGSHRTGGPMFWCLISVAGWSQWGILLLFSVYIFMLTSKKLLKKEGILQEKSLFHRSIQLF